MKKEELQKRPPAVVVMGHIDHGKSTLLDYIRESKEAEKETGGITQNVAAYEALVKDENNKDRKITFLDTPGHEAFSAIRTRGANVTDIAILIVSAEDGVKEQTLEAYKQIEESSTPFIVAINKVDSPKADVQKTKNELTENGIYIEGYGGDAPCCEISAKEGTGVNELLETILLLTDLKEFKSNPKELASGFIIESSVDSKRGISSTLLIKDGTLKQGMFVLANDAMCTARIMEDSKGKKIKEAEATSPVKIIGFNKLPSAGDEFISFKKKKDAEKELKNRQESNKTQDTSKENFQTNEELKIIPVIIKTDTAGSGEAIESKLETINRKNICFKVLSNEAGSIGEADIKLAIPDPDSIVLGFNTKIEKQAKDAADQNQVNIKNFNLIYEMIDYLDKTIEEKRPRSKEEEIAGKARIIRRFSQNKNKQVLGGKVFEGRLKVGDNVNIERRGNDIGKGKIVELQSQKISTNEVKEGEEFGITLEAKLEIAEKDVIKPFEVVEK